ncbi:MAG: aconitate hydratase AcnA [Spirochaetales bacterium]|uniref:Aconitate hydratase n=1 Tax=Candidatus Thalassospirochaeta sargassi TaxID=3119039 RepID=A0AAJ1IFN2_9SPIO|nr:aconitate hydratase AcnA [Spirochaetales bacterium]
MNTKKLQTRFGKYKYFSIADFADENGVDISCLPVSIKIVLENLLRHADTPSVTHEDLLAVAEWNNVEENSRKDISFHPSRIIMQDFTGGPAIADLAAMRDAFREAGGDGKRINPVIPVDMVIDHSVMIDYNGTTDCFKKNVDLEYKRNNERYRFFKWAEQAFDNFRVVPPETGIVHQVNLEYLASVVSQAEDFGSETVVFPDTLVGTDSHTTMINALSVLGWGVGGIEAEAAMLGQPLTMVIPDVIGFCFKGKLNAGVTATDLVLRVVNILREYGVVGSFVEFFGSGLSNLSLADRATISNMAPEYGATCGFFPIDDELLAYLRLTGRSDERISLVEAYAKEQGLWRDDNRPAGYTDIIELDLSTVFPAVAGPRRPQDLIALNKVPEVFGDELSTYYKTGNEGSSGRIKDGDVVIAAITSCTNTSNPEVLVAAGILAKKAVEAGLKSKPWVKTSFAPGSKVVTSYLENSGLMTYLEKLGFYTAAYGCTTCIGNSGPLSGEIAELIETEDLVTVNVLSGNRNFEGRINPLSRASFLASPPLVVVYALVGSVLTNVAKQSLGTDRNGKEIFLSDIWPSAAEINDVIQKYVKPELFHQKYQDVFEGAEAWENLTAAEGDYYSWEGDSTYIRKPPFFDEISKRARGGGFSEIKNARCLAIFPDSTTTDHISPAGNIPEDSPAGKYLTSRGISPEHYNSYGSRRANHEVMMRGTFANVRIRNKMLADIEGGYTKNSEGDLAAVFDAAMDWTNTPLIVFAGKEYGSGSSRDWAAKGPLLQGVKAVIAESFERIHRSNLVGMGILPLEFRKNENIESLGITGTEKFTISKLSEITPRGLLTVYIKGDDGKETSFPVIVRIDTERELLYWKKGGILNFVLSEFLDDKAADSSE